MSDKRTGEQEYILQLEAQRDVLLAALRATVTHVYMPISGRDADWHEAGLDIYASALAALAAIAKAEGK